MLHYDIIRQYSASFAETMLLMGHHNQRWLEDNVYKNNSDICISQRKNKTILFSRG